jgi:hypothetical protein
MAPSPTPLSSIMSNSARRPALQRGDPIFSSVNLPLPQPHHGPTTFTPEYEYTSLLSNTPLPLRTYVYPTVPQATNDGEPNSLLGSLDSTIPIIYLSQNQPQPQPPQHSDIVLAEPLSSFGSSPAQPPPSNPGPQKPAEDESAWCQAALKNGPVADWGYVYQPRNVRQKNEQSGYALNTIPQQPCEADGFTPTRQSYAPTDCCRSEPIVPSFSPSARSLRQQGPLVVAGSNHQGSFFSNGIYPSQVVGPSDQSGSSSVYPHSYAQRQTSSAYLGCDKEISGGHLDLFAMPANAGFPIGIAHEGFCLSPDDASIPLDTPSSSGMLLDTPGPPNPTQSQHAQYLFNTTTFYPVLFPGPYTS